MEQRAVADDLGLLHQGEATLGDGGVERRDCLKAPVDERLVDERPPRLGRLALEAVHGLEDQADAVGNGQVVRAVSAGIVALKHDALARPSPERFGEIGEDEFEHLLADGLGEVPDRLAGATNPLTSSHSKR